MSLLKISSNSKLGKGMASWNIPAVLTCPGRTRLCESVCYANKGLFKLQSNRHMSHKVESESNNFIEKINEELKSNKIKAVRLHASGDFYDNDYIDKWIKIIKANPNTRFWAYTRSWRRLDLVNKIKELAKLDNIQLFASIDSESKDQNVPIELRKADIVEEFDNRDSFVQCPNQKNKKITCDKCTYCFKPAGNKKIDVQFRIH